VRLALRHVRSTEREPLSAQWEHPPHAGWPALDRQHESEPVESEPVESEPVEPEPPVSAPALVESEPPLSAPERVES
jgi:hypothetical protein